MNILTKYYQLKVDVTILWVNVIFVNVDEHKFQKI